MDWLRKILKVLFSRNVEKSFAEIRFEADQKAMAEAKRAGQDTFKAPEPDIETKLACLKYWNSKQKYPVPDTELLSLEPSGLTVQELRDWYWGLRGAGTREYLKICNQSYSKTEVKDKQHAAGLDDVMTIMDKNTAECCESVLKFISD